MSTKAFVKLYMIIAALTIVLLAGAVYLDHLGYFEKLAQLF